MARAGHIRPAVSARALRIGLIIVTYDSVGVLAGCLGSLEAGSEGVDLADVVVVDNTSSDDSLRVAKEFNSRPVQTVQMGRNAGYAAGVNAGIGALDIGALDAIMVMNPDTRLRAGSLAILGQALNQPRRRYRGAEARVHPDGSLQLSLRREPAIHRALAESILGRAAARIGTLGELVGDPDAYEQAGEWAWATGAAMLMSPAMVAQVGKVGRSPFLLYSEETDYMLRAADHGWRLWYEPRAVVEHIGGGSATNAMLASLIAINRVTLFRRRHGRAAAAAFSLSVLTGEGLRAIAGRRPSRAAFAALMQPSRRIRELPA